MRPAESVLMHLLVRGAVWRVWYGRLRVLDLVLMRLLVLGAFWPAVEAGGHGLRVQS